MIYLWTCGENFLLNINARTFALDPASRSAIHSISSCSLRRVIAFSYSSLSMQSRVFYGCHSMSHVVHHGYTLRLLLKSYSLVFFPSSPLCSWSRFRCLARFFFLVFLLVVFSPPSSSRLFLHISFNFLAQPSRLEYDQCVYFCRSHVIIYNSSGYASSLVYRVAYIQYDTHSLHYAPWI